VREFDTGATRDDDDNKLDYDGFLSPYVLRRYAEYLHKHRTQADGKIRGSDNWQRGIPLCTYMKSMWRHFMSLWTLHRRDQRWTLHQWTLHQGTLHQGDQGTKNNLEEALCAVIFNASGYLHELGEKEECEQPKSS